jgi:RNA polymerase sigma factor (sigma-70 family)
MDPRSDRELIRGSVTSPTLFGEVFDRHGRVIFRYLRRRVGEDAAADITSEVFTRAFRDRSRLSTANDSALPWLLGIATNLLRMEHRTEYRRVRAYARAAHQTDLSDGVNIDDRLDAAAARGVLLTALELLSVRQRDVLLLSAWGELSPAEIAVALSLRPGTVRSELHRARARVASHLAAQAPHLVPDQDPIA